jgi:hypothetical protein
VSLLPDATPLRGLLFPQRGTVYAYDDATNSYSAVLKSDLAVRVSHVRGGQSRALRAELAAVRSLLWEPGYELPRDARVVVDGVTYDPVEGTWQRLPSDHPIVRRCDAVVVEVET